MSPINPSVEPSVGAVEESEPVLSTPNKSKTSKSRIFHNKIKKPYLKSKPSKLKGKNTLATFEKKHESTIISVYPRSKVFSLFTSFLGVVDVISNFYGILKARDYKITNTFFEDDLIYTVLLCVYYRCILLNNRLRSASIFHISELKTLVDGLQLPDVLASYVEMFGAVTLTNSAVVIPAFADYSTMKSRYGFLNPTTILQRLKLQPTIPNWGINPTPVRRYTNGISRALKGAMEIRPVRFSELEGRLEFLAVYTDAGTGQLLPLALDKIDRHQSALGAAYRLRDDDYQRFDIGTCLPVLFAGDVIDPETTLTNHVHSSLQQGH